jgi:ribosomal-protein-alanine N-acetyltransferase
MDLVSLPLIVERMQLAHVPAIMEIERESFSLPWPEGAYRHELRHNELAHYYVLRLRSAGPPMAPVPVWQRLWQAIRRRPSTGTGVVLGYGGFWLMYDEVHISTLAIRVAGRRRGLGELLLVALLDEAQRLGASRATLEVRVSNVAAQNLYAKYGFEPVGRRKGYYADNREDALILTTPEFASFTYRELIKVRRRDLQRRLAQASLDKILQMH